MTDFLEGIFGCAVTAFVIIASGIMLISPAIILAYLAYEKQSWQLGVLAFAVFIMCIGATIANEDVTNGR